MRITVFTPAYNRAYAIGKLYESLQRQSFHDFEWVVVDDGSTDDTEELFSRFLQADDLFPIHYVKTKNGGKHRAINKGVSIAKGELFFIVDSDDYLTDDALKTIDSIERSIPAQERKHFGGVCGQRGYDIRTPIGTSFRGDTLDATTLERPKYNISGDKAEVFYTEIMKQFPFPEFEGENFITECVVWDRIAAAGYKLRFFNEVSIICNYLPDGLTAQGKQLFLNNPKGYGLYLYQNAKFGKTPGIYKWNAYCTFYYEFRDRMRSSEMARLLHMDPLVFRLRILGMQIFYKLYDR